MGRKWAKLGFPPPTKTKTIPDEQKQLQHRAYKRSQSHINPLTTGMQPANNFADQKQVDNDVLHICICLLTTVIAFLLVCLSKRQIKEEWTIQIEQKLARLRSVFKHSNIHSKKNIADWSNQNFSKVQNWIKFYYLLTNQNCSKTWKFLDFETSNWLQSCNLLLKVNILMYFLKNICVANQISNCSFVGVALAHIWSTIVKPDFIGTLV